MVGEYDKVIIFWGVELDKEFWSMTVDLIKEKIYSCEHLEDEKYDKNDSYCDKCGELIEIQDEKHYRVKKETSELAEKMGVKIVKYVDNHNSNYNRIFITEHVDEDTVDKLLGNRSYRFPENEETTKKILADFLNHFDGYKDVMDSYGLHIVSLCD